MTLGDCSCGSGKVNRWHVWYKDCTKHDRIYPLYGTMCDDCATRDIVEGRNGWPVEAVKLVADQFLPEDDRAKEKEEELIED